LGYDAQCRQILFHNQLQQQARRAGGTEPGNEAADITSVRDWVGGRVKDEEEPGRRIVLRNGSLNTAFSGTLW